MKALKDILAKAAGSRPSGAKAASAGPRKAAGGRGESVFSRLARLYAEMEQAYGRCATAAGLSCEGCENNCCTSFFQHHTYLEWAYLWRGLQELPPARRDIFVKKARAYVAEARESLASGRLPSSMCPLNEEGLCALYAHRLMICRLHGTRNVFVLPDGARQEFPGCWRFSALPCAAEGNEESCPTLDRTPLYQELAALELEFLRRAGRPMPRPDLTLAEMIVLGPPKLR